MVRIEVIGLDPPCRKCSELLENAKKAVVVAGVEAEVVKLWTLAEEVREKYGLLLSPALAIEGVVVAQGKVYRPERIARLLQG
ncbi:MAG: thioredoxin family protein [Desulfobacterales bacterium]|nr:MAG: thioredoxin family protein [Desulfobacterales bacterium]